MAGWVDSLAANEMACVRLFDTPTDAWRHADDLQRIFGKGEFDVRYVADEHGYILVHTA